jgi:hypothetical protein
VRQPVADLHYGERLEVLHQEGAASQVRVSTGTTGWLLDSRQMMDATLWQRSADLLDRARAMPVQALGHTSAISNVHIDAGRNAQRIFQFSRGVSLAVLGRKVVADAGDAGADNAAGEEAASDAHKGKSEDWLLVMRVPGPTRSTTVTSVAADAAAATSAAEAPSTANSIGAGPEAQSANNAVDSSKLPIAGWVLARFVDADLPDAVKDHASSANMRPVAWFELNRVPDGSGGEAPQYLVAGARGSEGQECDFNMIQIYTWGAERMRYETAFVESDLCGKLPIRVSRAPRGPEFRFQNAGDDPGDFTYVMQNTIVRRVREDGPNPRKQTSPGPQKHGRPRS